MPRGRVLVPAGLIALLLFWLPPMLIALIGWPSNAITAPVAKESAPGPIAGPSPTPGMSPDLIRWTLVFAALAIGFAAASWLLALLLRKEIGTGPGAPARPRFYLLTILGLASLAIYGLNFLLSFPLQRYYNLKQISIGMIAERDGEVALGVALATVALFLLYTLAYRLCRWQNERRLWLVVLVGALLLALGNFFVSTITTLDPYDYTARGRITELHGANPYVLTPKDYPDDPFMDYVSWREKTSAYGPLWETVSAFTSRLAGGQLWPNLLAYKGLAALGYILSALLIAAILRRVAPERALAGTLLFAWNPLILMEGIANGHNDMLMLALLLAAFWALSRVRPPLETSAPNQRARDYWPYALIALVLLGAAILVKFVPILLLPFCLLYLLSGEKKWWRWPVWGLLLLLPVILLIAEYYLPFWQKEAITDTFTRRADMFRMSVGSVAKESLQQKMGENTAASLVNWPFQGLNEGGTLATLDREGAAKTLVTWPFLGGFALVYVGLLARAFWTQAGLRERLTNWLEHIWRVMGGVVVGALWGWLIGVWGWFPVAAWAGVSGIILSAAFWGVIGGILAGLLLRRHGGRAERPWDMLVRTSLYAFLLYLLLANFWFWPWYLIWPIGLLALLGDERLVVPLALAACAGEISHLGWNFVVYWWGMTWDAWYQMDALVVFGMVVPALLVYAILRATKKRTPRVL